MFCVCVFLFFFVLFFCFILSFNNCVLSETLARGPALARNAVAFERTRERFSLE